jgi:hypothetical protein
MKIIKSDGIKVDINKQYSFSYQAHKLSHGGALPITPLRYENEEKSEASLPVVR